MADSPVSIQAMSRPEPSTPSWLGEVVLIVEYLRKHGLLTKISEEVRLVRRRFGHYEAIDFLAVLFGYAERRGTDPGEVLPTTPTGCRPVHGLI